MGFILQHVMYSVKMMCLIFDFGLRGWFSSTFFVEKGMVIKSRYRLKSELMLSRPTSDRCETSKLDTIFKNIK